MKRSKHNLSHYKLFTCDMGELVPVCNYEVLPGDTIQGGGSMLLRVSPLLAPVMHPVSVRMHYWYVPYRLLWEGWEDFITGGSDGLGGSSGAFPTMVFNNQPVGSLSDYLGVTPGVAADISVSALPFRAYSLIFNEMYRDEDLVAEIGMQTDSGVDVGTNFDLRSIAWEKDYFTSARPWPQKGPEVTLPLGTSAPVVLTGSPGSQLFRQAVTRVPVAGAVTGAAVTGELQVAGSPAVLDPSGEYQVDLSNAAAASINDLRLAMALQRYQEARAQYGSRYVEYLRYYGIKSSDSRLQRPEYLGGGKQVISFSEVLQQGVTTDGDDTEGVGNLKGHGIAALRARPYRRFFEEHGVIIGLMSVRPRTMYVDGLHRSWSRRTKEDFWTKELELIGQQEVYSRELFAASDAAGGDAVFGYQDRYSEYRHMPSSISGEFRSSLNMWHMGRDFAVAPVLNGDFVTCDPTKRIHQVQTNDVLWCMFSNKIVARRMVTKNPTPRMF